MALQSISIVVGQWCGDRREVFFCCIIPGHNMVFSFNKYKRPPTRLSPSSVTCLLVCSTMLSPTPDCCFADAYSYFLAPFSQAWSPQSQMTTSHKPGWGATKRGALAAGKHMFYMGCWVLESYTSTFTSISIADTFHM